MIVETDPSPKKTPSSRDDAPSPDGLVQAARTLCRLRGLDPDETVRAGIGLVPRWHRFREPAKLVVEGYLEGIRGAAIRDGATPSHEQTR